MATFEYQALTPAGRLMKGTVEAASDQQANEMLTEMQLKVNSIAAAKVSRPRSRIGRNEFLLFNQQLASITKAGIPLEKGLREVAVDIESRSMRKLIVEFADDLEAGTSIEEALEKRQKFFPPLYSQIIKAGVKTGRLSEMLTSLNHHLEMSNQTRRIVFEAITYPLVVLALAAVILTGVFTFVMPHFIGIFADMRTDLPAITKFVLAVTHYVVPFWIAVAAIVAGLIVLTGALSSFPAGRRFKEYFYMRIPVLGRVYHRGLMCKLADAMGLLVSAGCDMPSCFRLSAGATGSEQIKAQCELVAAQIEQGQNIVEAGQLCSVIPPLFFYSMQLGYQRNELQDNLFSLSDMYSQQTRTQQSRLQAVLLPIMLIIVGGVIGLAVMAVFLPLPAMIQGASGM